MMAPAFEGDGLLRGACAMTSGNSPSSERQWFQFMKSRFAGLKIRACVPGIGAGPDLFDFS
jgi:hypothetical protein